mmetsp:Transcript_15111/g.34952  ORF Transcript_15111/g.34952 Transcript_15111/m.34952 type:complete len:234 (+) Transcript_15111:164-865(+)
MRVDVFNETEHAIGQRPRVRQSSHAISSVDHFRESLWKLGFDRLHIGLFASLHEVAIDSTDARADVVVGRAPLGLLGASLAHESDHVVGMPCHLLVVEQLTHLQAFGSRYLLVEKLDQGNLSLPVRGSNELVRVVHELQTDQYLQGGPFEFNVIIASLAFHIHAVLVVAVSGPREIKRANVLVDDLALLRLVEGRLPLDVLLRVGGVLDYGEFDLTAPGLARLRRRPSGSPPP